MMIGADLNSKVFTTLSEVLDLTEFLPPEILEALQTGFIVFYNSDSLFDPVRELIAQGTEATLRFEIPAKARPHHFSHLTLLSLRGCLSHRP
jgi:hypothetical protein